MTWDIRGDGTLVCVMDRDTVTTNRTACLTLNKHDQNHTAFKIRRTPSKHSTRRVLVNTDTHIVILQLFRFPVEETNSHALGSPDHFHVAFSDCTHSCRTFQSHVLVSVDTHKWKNHVQSESNGQGSVSLHVLYTV